MIKKKKVLVKTHTCLIHKVTSQIKRTQHLFECLGDRKTLIGYINSEAKENLKLENYDSTITLSQRKI